MPSARIRALSVSLALAAVVLAGCGKAATLNGPVWGTPDEAVKAAVEKLSGGFNYVGDVPAVGGRESVTGSENPGRDASSMVREDPAATTTTRAIQIGDELWMRYEGYPNFPGEWGHLAVGGGVFAAGAGMVGPATWLPALADEIVTVERTGPLRYGGILNFGEVSPQRTGISSYQLEGIENDDEVAFSMTIDPEGHIAHFEFVLEGPDGEMTMNYDFSAHGEADDVAAPTGEEITELTSENVLEWLLGGFGD